MVALGVMLGLALIPEKPGAGSRVGDPGSVSWDQVIDDPGMTLDLEWQGIFAYASAKEDSWIETMLEDRFQLRIHPVFLDANGFQRRRPMMLTGGDFPDVMWDGDPLGLRNNLRNGFVTEVPVEVILREAPHYVAFLNRYGREAWLYTHAAGRNYGIPTFFGDAFRPRIGAWRADWLEAVGIDRVPETVAEMGEALRRFRYEDPNGSGQTDTYGWSPAFFHWSVFGSEVFAAFDVLPFDFQRVDGQVVWGGIQPGALEGLRVLRQWYSDGLLDPDFLLDTRGKLAEGKFISGRTGYLYPVDDPVAYDAEMPGSLCANLKSFHPQARMVAGPPVRNAQGQRRGRSWGGAGHILQFSKPVETHPEKVLRTLRMLDTIAADADLYLATRYGRRGTHWEHDPEQGIIPLDPFRGNRTLSSREMLPVNTFFFPAVIPEYEDAMAAPRVRQWRDTHAHPDWALKNVLGKSDVLPSASRYLGDLRNFQITAYVEFIVGDRDLESFDVFVAEWRRRGGDVLTREANEMYATMLSVWEQVGALRPGEAGGGL